MFDFLGSPALTLAYYLFTFFSIEAALVIAWGQWQRSNSFRAYRLTIVFGSLTILRVMLFALILVASTSAEIANTWVPPFERVVALPVWVFWCGASPRIFDKKGLSEIRCWR